MKLTQGLNPLSLERKATVARAENILQWRLAGGICFAKVLLKLPGLGKELAVKFVHYPRQRSHGFSGGPGLRRDSAREGLGLLFCASRRGGGFLNTAIVPIPERQRNAQSYPEKSVVFKTYRHVFRTFAFHFESEA